jgi:hypothetical protein
MNEVLFLTAGLGALVIAFAAGFVTRSGRERRLNEVTELAFQELARRDEEARRRISALERQLQLSNE